MPSPSTISITLNGVEISDRVLFRESTFTSQANPIQGSFKVVVRDPDQNFAPVSGQKLALTIDGVPLFGGYVMKIGRGNFFPAANTAVPATVKSRKWILQGPDFNVLFDKRVLYDASDPAAALEVPSGKRTISKAFTYLMNNFIDTPAGLDYSSDVDVIDTQYGTEENGGLYVGQSKTLRKQMEDFADNGGVIYYIDAGFSLHLHEYEQVVSPWTFVDSNPNGVSTIGFREGEYEKDFTQIVTDALVWGGSTLRKPGGPAGNIVFARYPDPPAADATWHGRLQSAEREQTAINRQGTFGRWQYAEERAGQSNYLTQGSVKNRAFVIIAGPPGTVPTNGIEGGLGKPVESMRCVWFSHDVPSGQHIRPGFVQNFILYTQGEGGTPLVTTLPCRSMRISFPTLPTDNPGGETYVRFEGEFGTAKADSRHLWRFLRKTGKEFRNTTIVVDGDSTNTPPGAQGTFYPQSPPDGVTTDFQMVNAQGSVIGFLAGEYALYLNGLYQIPGSAYTYDSATRTFTFATAPGIGDLFWVTGYVSQ